MIPTKKQFMGWTIPSKWSFVGGIAGILSLLLALYAHFNPDTVSTLKYITGFGGYDSEAFNISTPIQPSNIKDGKYEIKYSVGFDAPILHGIIKKHTYPDKIQIFLAGKIFFKYYSFEFEGYEKEGRLKGQLVNSNDEELPNQPLIVSFYRTQRNELMVVVELRRPVYREVKILLESSNA